MLNQNVKRKPHLHKYDRVHLCGGKVQLFAGFCSFLQTIQITNAKVRRSGAVESVWQQGHTVLGVLRRWVTLETHSAFFFEGITVNSSLCTDWDRKEASQCISLVPLSEWWLLGNSLCISSLFKGQISHLFDHMSYITVVEFDPQMEMMSFGTFGKLALEGFNFL